MRRFGTIVILFLLAVIAHSQYSQYMVNGLVINPAYAGSRDGLSLSAHYSKVWTGISGTPEQALLSGHFPLKNDKLAFGVILGNRTIGSDRTQFGSLDYAYRIHLHKSILAFGLRGIVDFKNENFNQLYFDPAQPKDPVFVNNSQVEPNAGFGIYFYASHFFTGFSIPRMITYMYTDTVTYDYGPTLKPKYARFMATAGVVIGKKDGLKWRPSFLMQYVPGVKDVQLDVNTMFIFLKDRLWAGASYRFGTESVFSQAVGIIEFKVNNQLMVGYSYDYGLGNIGSVLNASHEIFLRYDFVYRIKAANPRYF